MFSDDQLELIQGVGLALGLSAVGATLAMYWTIISVAPIGACGSMFATELCGVVRRAELLGYSLASLAVVGFLAVFGTEYRLDERNSEVGQ